MRHRWCQKKPSVETRLILFIVIMLLIYVSLWTLYFLGVLPRQ